MLLYASYISRAWVMWVSWSMMWCSAADDAFAVAWSGSSPHWESLPHFYTLIYVKAH